MTPINTHGKPFDDFDALKMRVNLLASGLIDAGDSYGIYSKSGNPLTGFVSHDKKEVKNFTHESWQ